ncbi:MAG: hypothetical protein ACW99A_20395, partial [Candidatus Kariarchaeaceae archaeon]
MDEKQQPINRNPTKDKKNITFRIATLDPEGNPIQDGVEVFLYKKDDKFQFKPLKNGLFEISAKKGDYHLQARSKNYVSARINVNLRHPRATFPVYLGERDAMFYRFGDNIIPFKLNPKVIAIAFPQIAPKEKKAEELTKHLLKEFSFRPFTLKDIEGMPFKVGEGGIWIFQTDEKINVQLYKKVKSLVQKFHTSKVRIGIPIDITPSDAKVIDNRYVVRFRPHLKPAQIDIITKKRNAIILRSFIQAENARLIEFQEGDMKTHLEIVESWYKQGLLIYGEPDILAVITDDQFPVNPPNDPTYPNQLNLTLQNADDAWLRLNGVDPNLTLGNPSVYVATIDRGVDTDHPDIGGNLTDGTPQLAQCFDFSGMRQCTVPGYAPDTSHGMGVYGIIAALV